MAQVTEQRSSSAQPNIQDVFLNYARARPARRRPFTCSTDDQFDGRIKNFDRFAVIVEVNGADQLVFKHAIATIGTQRSVANYFAAAPSLIERPSPRHRHRARQRRDR